MIMRAKQRAQAPSNESGSDTSLGSGESPLELTPELELGFDPGQWADERSDERGAGGRRVLGIALSLIATTWIGWSAWSAGRTLGGEPFSSPLVVQWIAIATGPLALLGLVWLIFGRTRRKESERFTRSVVAMRAEARSLEALLEVLSQRLSDSQNSVRTMAEELMGLGDNATGKLDGITRSLDESGRLLAERGSALDLAAESARNDIAVLLDDLPRAEETARLLSDRLRTIGSDSAARSSELRVAIDALANEARSADQAISGSSERIAAQLESITSASSGASDRVGAVEASLQGALDTLLARMADTLDQVRAGIDAQAASIIALVEQAEAGIARSGAESSAALASNTERADTAIQRIAQNLVQQEEASRRMIAEIEGGLAQVDSRVAALASNGDERARRFLAALHETRAALDSISDQAGSQDDALAGLVGRSNELREQVDRLAEVTNALRPEVDSMRESAIEANAKVASTGVQLATQRDQLDALLATIGDGTGDAQGQLIELSASISRTRNDAAALANETGPALVAALLQVKEAASHAAERAREAIGAVIPETAGKLSERARDALVRTVEDVVLTQMRTVETVAARAVDAARGASDQLSRQMLSLGQSAAALEAHLEKTSEDQRERDSEAFARRVALLIDSMNSAAIDVGKILSDEVDDKAWDAYLKGDRSVFTRRAVRLLDGSEIRAIRAHYESDREFGQSANRYVHDFEAMLRRVLAERDGGMIAVTLMSSDMGKLYAALAQVIERKR